MFEAPLLFIKIMLIVSAVVLILFCMLEIYARLTNPDWESIAEQQSIRLVKDKIKK